MYICIIVMLLGGGEHNEGDGIRAWLYTMGVVEYGRADGRWEMMAAVEARCDARRRVPVTSQGMSMMAMAYAARVPWFYFLLLHRKIRTAYRGHWFPVASTGSPAAAPSTKSIAVRLPRCGISRVHGGL